MKNQVIPCEIYSRVAGYYRPVQNWNPGKQQEFSERTTFDPVFNNTFKGIVKEMGSAS